MKRFLILVLLVVLMVGCNSTPTPTEPTPTTSSPIPTESPLPTPPTSPLPTESPLSTPQAKDAGAVVVEKSLDQMEGTNTMDFAIAGIGIAALILGITEALKEFGVSGKASRAVVLVLGFFFAGLAVAITQGMIPADAVVYVELVITALAGGLSAMGYYDFIRKLVA